MSKGGKIFVFIFFWAILTGIISKVAGALFIASGATASIVGSAIVGFIIMLIWVANDKSED